MPAPTLRAALTGLTLAAAAFASQGQPASAAVAPPAVPAAAIDIPIPDIPYTKFVLKNGLTLLVHEDHKLPVVTVNTWYHVGSKNESPGKTGFAHLFEHLMFSGSENFDRPYLSAMGSIGATSMNGTTNSDRTNYFENVPTSMLEYALFAESDRMGHLLGVLDQKKLDLQRGVVQNEKRQGESRPYGVTRQLLAENTYPSGHPYSWTTIGSMKDLDAASMTDVREWFKTHYGPNNVTLVLAGDITPEAARQKVEKYYGDLPPGPPLAQHREWIAKRSGTQRGTVQDRVPQGRIYRVWNVPAAHSPTDPLLDLAAQVLGGGKISRLYDRLVVREQLATSATAANDTAEIGGQFGMILTARPGADLARLEGVADEELARLLREGPGAEELQLAKTTILARYARNAERVGSFGGKSDLLAACMTYTGNPDCYKTDLQRLKAATPAQVKQVMNEWLSDGDYVLTVTPFPEVSASATGVDRKAGPPLSAPPSLALPLPRHATLSNGLKLLLVERHTAPVLNLTLLVDSGAAADPPALPGLGSLALRLMEEGTPSRDARTVAAQLEALGAGFDARVNLDGALLSLNVLKPALAATMPIYADLVLHPAFRPDDVERLRQQQIAAVRREQANVQSVGQRLLPGLLFGPDHPYGHPADGTEASLARMTRDDLVGFHRRWFKPNNATLVVAGDITLEQLQPMLEQAFASWTPGPVPAQALPQAALPRQPEIYLVDRPGAQQSVIYAAQLLQPVQGPERVYQQLLNSVFGGNFSSRINMNLREDKHWSYGVRSDIEPALGQRAFISRSPVQADKTREALQELAREYADIAGARPVGGEELRAAQDRESLSLAGAFETVDRLAGAYATLAQYGLPESYFNDFAAVARALTPQQANTLAQHLIEPQHLTWVVVGDMARVEAGIRELKLGEVHRIDGDGRVLP
jgi:zinc protease